MGDAEITNADLFMLLKEIKKDNEDIKASVKQIREDQFKQTTRIEQLNTRIDALESENKALREKLRSTQRNTKKNNIIIFGIPEEEDPKSYFTEVLKNKLEIDLEERDVSTIYRIGTQADNKPRAVLLEFVRNIKKQEIFQNIFKFRGSGLSIANDLIQEDREQQKLLYKHLKQAKDKKYQAKIVKNKLIVNGESFTYEQLKNSEVEDPGVTNNQIPFVVRGNRSAPSTPSANADSPVSFNYSGASNTKLDEAKKGNNSSTEDKRQRSNEIIQPLAVAPPSKSTRSNRKPSDTTLASPSVRKSKK